MSYIRSTITSFFNIKGLQKIDVANIYASILLMLRNLIKDGKKRDNQDSMTNRTFFHG